ncbi:saccharopine dehydrogenase family protein [bacterium]|jgi:saccharopine dehydrogenase (NAD+, L-lysine forming)|nr:saccharopine dehydrogenase family protein [Verrucomicrobiota bacterium]MDA7632640.1 saccharopine dehydrogenase family protein [bacterium]MDA7657098.1 saccharopine dehydrogenase family protein [Verrucomicrobiota bacterium]
MGRVLIIGAGGVGRVVAHKCAQDRDVFSEICLASRSIAKCDLIASEIQGSIETTTVDADQPSAMEALIRDRGADVVINVASPYQNLPIMEACARSGVHYVDTSLDDERDRIKYDYADQLAFDARFKEVGATGVLSIGFDPGVVNVYCAHAQKHLFDSIESIDIIDCNAGDHGYEFATNFDPETNIREILADVIAFKDGEFRTTKALRTQREFDFPEIGSRMAYLMTHEEVLTIAKCIPGVKNVRFWMTFSEKYLTHLRVLENIGMTSIEPILFEGKPVVPLQFLKTLLPDPASLGPRTKGKTCIGCLFEGKKDGKSRKVLIYNNCVHEECYAEVQSQAVSYTTGVPAVLTARLILSGDWAVPGVHCVEQLDPDPFMGCIGEMGLPWKVRES